MIKVSNLEAATRTIEAFNALSVVLPIYDDEARSVFRASFRIDMADLMPEFFRNLALIALRNKTEFDSYLNYFEELIKYIKQDRKKIPLPSNVNDSYFIDARSQATKLLNAWLIRQEPIKKIDGELK